MSSNISVRSTTDPEVTAKSLPTAKAVVSTMLGTRGLTAMSEAKFRAPRR